MIAGFVPKARGRKSAGLLLWAAAPRQAQQDRVERWVRDYPTLTAGIEDSRGRPPQHTFFYPAEGADAVAYHKTAAALSSSSKTGLTAIEDVVPFIRHLVSDGWWVTGQTILINGGYTTK